AMRTLALLVLVGLTTACPAHAPSPMPSQPPTADSLLGELAARRTLVRSIRAKAKVEYWDKDRIKGRISLFATRDGHLRLELETTLGMVLALSVAGGSFQLLDVKNDRYYTGEASTCNVERVIRVRLPPAQIADVLLGDAPVLPHKGAQVTWNGNKRRWALVLE